jgi:hypothetical protein
VFSGPAAGVFFREFWLVLGYPLPPIPVKTLLGAGFAKSVCKILIADGLRVKILSANELRVEPLSLPIPPPL